MGVTAPFRPMFNATGSNIKEAVRVFTVNANLTYYGFAKIGTLDATAGWMLQRAKISGLETRFEFAGPKNGNVWNAASVLNITGATNANPCVLTVASTASLTTGKQAVIYGVGGMTQINNLQFAITVINATTFSIPVDSTAYGVYTSGGSVLQADFMQSTYA